MSSACYVYAILTRETPLPPGLRGFEGAAVSLVPYRALAAATSPLERGAPGSTAENVWRHEAVVESLRQQGPALPVRFGTVLADASAVAHALGERYDELAADLARLGDKIEFGLSVLWDPPITPEEEDQAPGSGASREAQGQGRGSRYLHARLAAYRREAAVRERAGALARELDRELSVHTLERRCTLLPTPRLAVRAAYLLDSERVPAFQDAFARFRQTHPDLRLLLSGPWPPYSFVTPPDGGGRKTEDETAEHSSASRLPSSAGQTDRPNAGTSSTAEHIV